MKVWSAAENERILEEYPEQDVDGEVNCVEDDSNPSHSTVRRTPNATTITMIS